MSSSSLQDISSNIRLAESNKHNLGKAIDHLRSYSSEVLLVTAQWKDLQDLSGSTQASIQHQFDELTAKTSEFEHRVKEFEDRERFMEQIFEGWGFREKGLGGLEEIKVMEEKMKERLKEIERKEKHFNSWDRNVRLEERLADSEAKEKRFESKQKLFDSRVRDVELRERRLEERLRDFKAKEKRFVVDASSIEKRLKVIAGKEKEVDALKRENEKQLEELELKEKVFEEREKKFGFNVMEKELKLDAIRKKYEVGMKELQSKQKEIEAKEKKLNSDVRSMEEHLKSVEEKELKIDEIRRGYEKRVDELQSKEKELEAKEKRLNCVHEKELELAEILKGYEKCVDELELKEKEFACKEKRLFFDVKSVEKRLKYVHEKELEMDEIREGYEKRVDELELKEKEFASKGKRLFFDAKLVEEQLAVIEAKEKEVELIRKEERLIVTEAKKKVLELIRKVPELYGLQDLNEGSSKQLVPEEMLQAKYVSRAPNSKKPGRRQRLRKKKKLRIRFAPPTAIAALPAVASFATPDAPSDSKPALSDPATTFDVKSSAAEATTPPVTAATGSQMKHDRDDAPAPTVKPQEQQQGRNKRSRTDSLAGAQISAVHSVQPLPKQQAGICVNQDNLHGNTSTGKYAIRSYPPQFHMPRPHDFAYNGTQTAAATAHPLDSIRDPGFSHTHSPPHIEPGLYGRPGSAFHKQGDEVGQCDLPNPPNYHSH